MSDNFVNIADANHPNAGRIYDYFLGGNHNFEIDRQAAQGIIKMAPFMTKIPKLIRWFLGEAVRRLSAEGYRTFLDFASGLPTVDHIHQIAPKGTKVIYSDIDPVTVAYGQDIIGDNPDVRMVHCDVSKPEQLLASEAVKTLVGRNRKVAIGFNGIAWFLSDEQIRHFLQVAYEWADKGSKLFLCDVDQGDTTASLGQFADIYKNLRQPIFLRTNARLQDLVRPWRVTEPGFQLLEEWYSLKAAKKVVKEAAETLGGEILGGILVK